MKIIHFTLRYKQKLLTTYQSIWAEEPYGELFSKDEVEETLEKQDVILLAIDVNDNIIGFITGYNFDRYGKSDEISPYLLKGTTFYLADLAVVASHRKQGIAQKLYKQLQNWLLAQNYDQIILRTSESPHNVAINFYRNLKFAIVADTFSYVEQARIDDRPIQEKRIYLIKDISLEPVCFTKKYDYELNINKFKRRHNIKAIIGISGGANPVIPGLHPEDQLQLDLQDVNKRIYTGLISDFLNLLKGYNVAILTGGTQGGIPELATKIAKSFGFKTIGVYPEAGGKYALGEELLDLRICVEPLYGASQWGDEAAVWTGMIDGVMVLGGAFGTLIECAHLLKINEARVKKSLVPKFIVPIAGLDGTSSSVNHLIRNPELQMKIMPHNNIGSGREAAKFLLDKLCLSDFFEYKS
jgi:ribosomal protein S18 acetylase RimI-like enzyme